MIAPKPEFVNLSRVKTSQPATGIRSITKLTGHPELKSNQHQSCLTKKFIVNLRRCTNHFIFITSGWTSVDRRGSFGAAIDFCIPPIYYNCQLNNLAFASPLNAQGSLPNTCFELMGWQEVQVEDPSKVHVKSSLLTTQSVPVYSGLMKRNGANFGELRWDFPFLAVLGGKIAWQH